MNEGYTPAPHPKIIGMIDTLEFKIGIFRKNSLVILYFYGEILFFPMILSENFRFN